MIYDLANLLSFFLILGGLASILYPFLPAIPAVWFGIFLYAIIHQYVGISRYFLMILTLIALFTILLDYTLSRSGVRKLQAGPWGVLGAILGAGVGSFFGPIYAYLIGPIVGAIIAELLRGRDQIYTYQSGNYTVVAFMGGTLIKLVAAIAMIGLFLLRLQHRL